MNRYLILFITGLILTGSLSHSPAFSQDITNPESEYMRIRAIAFEGDYANAAAAARRLVNAYPSYGDARILLGRILAWQKDYQQAAAVIDTLLAAEPDNADALSARRDISLWSKENTPVATDIRAGYSFDSFNKPYTRFWQVYKAGAGHRFNWGPASAGLNIGDIRIETDTTTVDALEYQFEAEAWPKLTDKNYAYLAYAFSPGSYFPSHRAAIELWQILPKGWAISAGMNYYYFDRNSFIAGLSVEKYAGKFWLSLKSYFYFKDDGMTTSFYFNGRRYFNDTDYLQITLGTGTAPDEPFDVQPDVMRLSANSIRLAYYTSLTNKLTLRIGAGYSYEEYAEDACRNRFEGHIHIIYAIKMK
jgi:YaiO family outer membrane protein